MALFATKHSFVGTNNETESASGLAAYASAVAKGTAKENKDSLRDLLKNDGIADAGVEALLNDELIDMARRYIDGTDAANPKERPSLWKKAIQTLTS